MIIATAINCMDTIPDYLCWPGRLEKEVVVQPPDLGKKIPCMRVVIYHVKLRVHALCLFYFLPTIIAF